jgi:hypothetical protein
MLPTTLSRAGPVPTSLFTAGADAVSAGGGYGSAAPVIHPPAALRSACGMPCWRPGAEGVPSSVLASQAQPWGTLCLQIRGELGSRVWRCRVCDFAPAVMLTRMQAGASNGWLFAFTVPANLATEDGACAIVAACSDAGLVAEKASCPPEAHCLVIICAMLNSSGDSTADLEAMGWSFCDSLEPSDQLARAGQGVRNHGPRICKSDTAWSAVRQVAEVRAPRAILL